jgi:predicted RNA binding protein YcfA (HicA-like mRNA interferase family)
MNGGRLPVVNGRQVVRALAKAGFVVDRVAGSHHILVYPTDPRRTVTVPVHGARDLRRGTLRAILRQAGLSVEEFVPLL